MFFLFLLAISTVAIAGSAAYFSVYGLANTFSGVFWSVVIMGASLEAGKLIAASALYRHWNDFHFLLKSYLVAGVLALMLLTSGGIFGYLSSGYQTDVLPLKQIEAQITLLTEEKERNIQRKKDIDVQISTLPSNFVKSRIKLMREFRDEQQIVTERIRELDKEMLELQKKVIQVEAHIGPITYIAKAFDTPTDNATKWLVFLIIFTFDPMAVALTLTLNVVIRLRQEQKKKITPQLESPQTMNVQMQPPVKRTYQTIAHLEPELELEPESTQLKTKPEFTQLETKPESIAPIQRHSPERHVRQYAAHWTPDASDEKINQLREQYAYLQARKKEQGGTLSKDDSWELAEIQKIFAKYDIVA
jgi:hypothetical protein